MHPKRCGNNNNYGEIPSTDFNWQLALTPSLSLLSRSAIHIRDVPFTIHLHTQPNRHGCTGCFCAAGGDSAVSPNMESLIFLSSKKKKTQPFFVLHVYRPFLPLFSVFAFVFPRRTLLFPSVSSVLASLSTILSILFIDVSSFSVPFFHFVPVFLFIRFFVSLFFLFYPFSSVLFDDA